MNRKAICNIPMPRQASCLHFSWHTRHALYLLEPICLAISGIVRWPNVCFVGDCGHWTRGYESFVRQPKTDSAVSKHAESFTFKFGRIATLVRLKYSHMRPPVSEPTRSVSSERTKLILEIPSSIVRDIFVLILIAVVS
jgi:hypothetical protein